MPQPVPLPSRRRIMATFQPSLTRSSAPSVVGHESTHTQHVLPCWPLTLLFSGLTAGISMVLAMPPDGLPAVHRRSPGPHLVRAAEGGAFGLMDCGPVFGITGLLGFGARPDSLPLPRPAERVEHRDDRPRWNGNHLPRPVRLCAHHPAGLQLPRRLPVHRLRGGPGGRGGQPLPCRSRSSRSSSRRW